MNGHIPPHKLKLLIRTPLFCVLAFMAAPAFAAANFGCSDPLSCSDTTGNVTFISGVTTVGDSGTGTLTFNSVTVNIGPLIVGSQYGSIGTVTLNGGTLSDDAVIGDAGTGTFNNNSGTHNVSGNLILGNQSTGIGTYTIIGTAAKTNVGFVPGGNGAGNPNGALIVGEFGTGSFIQGLADGSDSPTVSVAGDLVLGHQGLAGSPDQAAQDSVGTYTINSGTLTVGGSIGVGTASTATDGSGNPLNVFTQNGGTVTITGLASSNSNYVGVGTNDHTGELFIGGAAGPNNDGGTGAYIMTGGELDVGLIEAGHTGLGVMTQSDGTVNASIWLGNAGGSNGTYNLNGGTINAGSELIALDGNGTFTQTAGVNTISGLLDVGYASGQGAYNLSGGSVSAGTTIIGDGTSTGCNGCGYSYNGLGGILNISGTASLTTGEMTVGVLKSGTVNQSGGTVSATSLTLGVIGFTPNASGYYNLTGTGQLSVSGDETIGVVGFGQVTQGTIGDAGLTSNSVTGNLILGAFDNIDPNTGTTPREGVYILNSGTLTTDNTIVGSLNVGTFTQNGGTHTVAHNLVVGDQSIPSDPTACGGNCISGGPSEGTYTLNGGLLTVKGDMTVGNFGNGNLVVNSGIAVIDGVLGIGINGTGTGTQIGGSVTALDVDLSTPVGSGSSSYSLSGGTLHTTADLNVGGAGAGPILFNQTGGTVNVDGTVRVGNLNSNASYKLSAGTLNVRGDSVVGNDALSGTMTQSDTSSHLINGTLIVGDGAGSNGVYTLTGGILTTGLTGGSGIGDIVIGSSGTGELDNSGGVQTSSSVNGFTLGFFGGSQGTYKLTGTGSLSVVAGNENVGVFGTGIFVQGDGSGNTSNTVSGSLYISSGFGGPSSSYTLKDGTLTVGGDEVVGFGAQGSFAQSGGSNSVTGNLILGLLSNAPSNATQFGKGAYLMDGGTLTTNGLVVGNSGTGTFTQNSGTVNVNTAFTMYLGADAGSTGTYTLSAGALNVTTSEEKIGGSGTGYFYQSGGAHNFSGAMYLGDQATGYGEYHLTGGALTAGGIVLGEWGGTGKFIQGDANGSSSVTTGNLVLARQGNSAGTYELSGVNSVLHVTGDEVVGGLGVGTFTQTGGNNSVSGTLFIAQNAGSAGTYNLNSGTLDAANVINHDMFNYVGGSFTAGILNNSGTIKLNANNLAVTTDFTNTGTLDIGIAGLNSYGVLSVGGTANLGGTLAVDFLNGYRPTVGTSFEVMTFGSSSGVFTNSSWTFDGVTFTAEYNANNFTLDVTSVAAVPEPETWAMMMAGLVLVGFAARRQRA